MTILLGLVCVIGVGLIFCGIGYFVGYRDATVSTKDKFDFERYMEDDGK